MSAQLLSPEQLYGVYERLAIANQNIRDLDTAISEFLEPLPSFEIKVDDGESIITQVEHDGWENLQKCSKETRVPIVFSIRAGEIIHHLRSCLDHIAWQLSDPIKREEKPKNIQFPIVLDWHDKNELARYDRQTKLITNSRAMAIIQQLQPAGRNIPKDDLLWIVHDMDIIDKHRELVLILWAPRMQGPSRVTRDYAPIEDAHGTRMFIPILGTAKVYANMKISLNVTFAQFGNRENQSVIKSLSDLTNRIREVVDLFA